MLNTADSGSCLHIHTQCFELNARVSFFSQSFGSTRTGSVGSCTVGVLGVVDDACADISSSTLGETSLGVLGLFNVDTMDMSFDENERNFVMTLCVIRFLVTVFLVGILASDVKRQVIQ